MGAEDCRWCRLVSTFASRRFFRDHFDEPFVIVDNLEILMPMLVYEAHGDRPKDIEEFVHAYECANAVGKQLYGTNYFLNTNESTGHFCVFVKSL